MGRSEAFEGREGCENFLVRGRNQQAIGAAGIDDFAGTLPLDIDSHAGPSQDAASQKTVETSLEVFGRRIRCPDRKNESRGEPRKENPAESARKASTRKKSVSLQHLKTQLILFVAGGSACALDVEELIGEPAPEQSSSRRGV